MRAREKREADAERRSKAETTTTTTTSSPRPASGASARAPTQGSGSVRDGNGAIIPRGEPPAGYAGFYCKEDGIKCHTRTGRCWSADVCQFGSDAAPPPAGGLSHFWN